MVGRLHVAAEIAAVDFNFLAGAADDTAFHFFGHRLAQLVQQNEGGLVGRAKIAGHGESALALHLIGEDGDSGEIDAQRQLVRRKERPAGHAEILRAGAATEARRAARAPAVIGVDAAAMRAYRLAVGLRPAHAAEHRLGVRVRHAEDAGERKRLGARERRKCCAHVVTYRFR